MSAAHRTHVLDIYGTHLHAAYTTKQWRRIRKTIDTLPEKPDAAGAIHTFTYEPDYGGLTRLHVVIWIDTAAHKNDTAELVDTCAHEATHAALAIHKHAGATPDGEPLAYLTGWLTAWLWTRLP